MYFFLSTGQIDPSVRFFTEAQVVAAVGIWPNLPRPIYEDGRGCRVRGKAASVGRNKSGRGRWRVAAKG